MTRSTLVRCTLLLAASWAAVGAALAGADGGAGCSPQWFPLPYSQDVRIFAGAEADLNGDGVKEVLLSKGGPVGVYADANHDGIMETLQIASAAGTAATPKEIVAADVDGDGDLDVATVGPTQSTSHSVGYYRNDNGALVGAASYLAGSNAKQICAGDLNGDGKAELVTGSYNPSLVYIFRGGSTVPLQPITLDAPAHVTGVVMGDVDADGDQDLVAMAVPEASPGVTFVLYRNEGNNTFTTVIGPAVSTYGGIARAADLDHDGDADICMMRDADSAGTVYVLYSSGGNLGAPQQVTVGMEPRSLELRDINGDTHVDMVVGAGQLGAGAVCVRLGIGDGSFAPTITYGAPVSPIAMALVDLNHDGYQDAILCDTTQGNQIGHCVLDGRAGGAFAGHSYLLLGHIQGYAAADIDGDQDDDVVASVVGTPSGLRVMRCNGDGTYGLAQSVPASVGNSANSVRLADFDGDGDVDAAVALPSFARIDLFKNLGDGTFAAPVAIPCPGIGDALEVADMNGNGSMDLVAKSSAAPYTKVLLNDGAGNFGPPLAQPLLSSSFEDFKVADMDGDGDVDVVSLGGPGFGWWPNNGSGELGAKRSIGYGGGGFNVNLADMDWDGDQDVLVRLYLPEWNNAHRMGIFINNGFGQFSQGPPFVLSQDAREVRAADLDQDGLMDLILASNTAHAVKVHRGLGDMFFDGGRDYALISQDSDVLIVNANMDAFPDIVARPPSVTRLTSICSTLCVPNPLAGDLNGDGAVNGADLGMLLSAWGAAPAGEPADLDRSGAVDGSDLGTLLSNWSHL